LRFFYWKVLKRRDLGFDDIPMPKRIQKNPVVLSPAEIIGFGNNNRSISELYFGPP